MNRTDRLLAIVLELQGRGHRRAEDLAATFETSKRTIYRDIQALGEAGVPVVAVPGRGYSLIEGYFLPPLSFTADEATMLLLGGDVMRQSFDRQYGAAAEAASRKISGVLPERLRDEVEALRRAIAFVVPARQGRQSQQDEAARLQIIRQAIIERRRLRFGYHARPKATGAPDDSTREVDPYGLAHVGDIWYLMAFDHTRRAPRTFRLGRMDDVTMLAATFTRPEGGPPLMLAPALGDGTVVVRALFDTEIARWVRESPSFFRVGEEMTPDGLLVTLHPREEGDVVQWLLGWGSRVRVLEPESLRRRIAAEGEALARNHR